MSSGATDFHLGPWREVAERVWLATAEPERVNLGLIAGSDRAVLVDTGSSPLQGAALRASVAQATTVPLLGVVVTHWHYDHAFGLGGFSDLLTLGHETLRSRLASPEALSIAARLGIGPEELVAPAREIAVAAGLDLGGRRIEVAHLGRGHTEGDLLVVVPDADVVFAGDLVESAGPVWYGPDSFAQEWPGTLDGLLGLMTESTRVIPGHGSPLDREAVFETRGRVAAVAGEISRLVGLGIPVREALARGDWALPADHIEPGLAAAFAQLGPQVAPGRPLPRV
jgi:glyoxylase-like metal-dependent hydrolase (beta-lactamase superfamily II)